jgi:hypothetical protein
VKRVISGVGFSLCCFAFGVFVGITSQKHTSIVTNVIHTNFVAGVYEMSEAQIEVHYLSGFNSGLELGIAILRGEYTNVPSAISSSDARKLKYLKEQSK